MRLAAVLLAAHLAFACSQPISEPPADPPDEPMPPDDDDDEEPTVIERLEAWNATLSAADRQAKYCKMAVSPFTFYRGTNHLFWEDTWGDARLVDRGAPQDIWLQGDLHVANFGAYDNDEGTVVYSLNDFDETIIADYQYDLWRLATSVVLVARANGLPEDVHALLVDRVIAGYLAAMTDYAAGDGENQRVFDKGDVDEPLRSFLEKVESKNSRLEALETWTRVVDGERELDTELDDLEAISPELDAEIRDAMARYGDSLSGGVDYDPDHFAVKSVARRLHAGTGSLGTPRYYLLIEGASGDDDDDRILDLKRQSAPTAYHFADAAVRERYDASFPDHAIRHALGYKALEVDTDDYLGFMTLESGSYSVRERSVFKKSLKLEELQDAGDLESCASQWGLILATAHARADIDFDPSLIPVSIDRAIAELSAGREGELSALIGELAADYADRVERDWSIFVDALAPTDCP